MSYLFCFLGILLPVIGAHASELDELHVSETAHEPLFVSLGSSCEPAHMLRFCKLRREAFPFDWLISFDGEKLIELLEDNFLRFLNEDDLVAYDFGGALLHTYYHLEFLHDGDWRGAQYTSNMQILKPKFERRIERFRNLNHYPDPVIFIRSAYPNSFDDPHRFFRFQENLEITDEYAWRLYHALKRFFPDLKFSLIIINLHDRGEFEVEKKLSDHLIKMRANSTLNLDIKISNYHRFFTQLLRNESFNCFDRNE